MSEAPKKPGSAGVLTGNKRKNADGDVGASGEEWYTRGYLPHRDRKRLQQSVTFRLADSLPQQKLSELQGRLSQLSQEHRQREERLQIEKWLDAGMGGCALGHPEVAQYVQDALLHFHGQRYALLAWCIMPNHVHALFEPWEALSKTIKGWKSYTARWALAQKSRLALRIGHANAFWMREYWDRFIRDDEHRRQVIDYIHQNPVGTGLCQAAEDWPWSSAYTGAAGIPGSAGVPTGNKYKKADEDVGAPGMQSPHE